MRLEERVMNGKCPKCGSGNIMEGKLSTGMGGLVFVTKESCDIGDICSAVKPKKEDTV